jgi:NAD(P)-dependent dehydrogenase (short-subunit alcohol dehydrogenase family)
MTAHPDAGGAVLVTGLDGPLAQAIARRLASEDRPLVLAAPTLSAARESASRADYIRAINHRAGGIYALAADPARAGDAVALLASARDAVGRVGVVVTCARVAGAGRGDGAPVADTAAFEAMLDAVAALPADERPRDVVLAARAFPPLDAADARAALWSAARARRELLNGTEVHVFAAIDPKAGAAARAFGLMDRPFNADVEFAQRRLEGAADAVHALLMGQGVR